MPVTHREGLEGTPSSAEVYPTKRLGRLRGCGVLGTAAGTRSIRRSQHDRSIQDGEALPSLRRPG